MLQTNFGDVGDGAQAVPLGALPLVDGLSVDGVPQFLSALELLSLLCLPWIQRDDSSAKSI